MRSPGCFTLSKVNFPWHPVIEQSRFCQWVSWVPCHCCQHHPANGWCRVRAIEICAGLTSLPALGGRKETPWQKMIEPILSWLSFMWWSANETSGAELEFTVFRIGYLLLTNIAVGVLIAVFSKASLTQWTDSQMNKSQCSINHRAHRLFSRITCASFPLFWSDVLVSVFEPKWNVQSFVELLSSFVEFQCFEVEQLWQSQRASFHWPKNTKKKNKTNKKKNNLPSVRWNSVYV